MLVTLAALAALAAPPAGPQEEPGRTLANGLRLRVLSLPGARETALVLVVRCGSDHDPDAAPGLAAVLGELLRTRAAAQPEAERMAVQVLGPATVLQRSVAAARTAEALQEYAALLSGEPWGDADAIALALGRATLAADEALQLYPGTMLEAAARAALLAGRPGARPPGGAPEVLRGIAPALVQARAAAAFRPRNAVLVLLGAAPPDELLAAAERACGALAAGPEPPAPVTAAAPGIPDPRTHARIDGPFVAAAFAAPAPAAPDFAAFVLATGVLRTRAARAFLPYRGGELGARAPLVAWNAFEGAPVLLLCRRGRNGDTPDPARQELERLLRAFAEPGPFAREIDAARAEALASLDLPPFADPGRLARSPRLAAARAWAVGLAEVLGWPADLEARLAAVGEVEVRTLVRARLAPGMAAWRTLIPEAGAAGAAAAKRPPGG
ncbi:MAG: insulinase family protein [Planctomycetes bacterium]|nr:insulinase family protein [Planctomycetota bacterium]